MLIPMPKERQEKLRRNPSSMNLTTKSIETKRSEREEYGGAARVKLHAPSIACTNTDGADGVNK
jgi:hypothetical protein